MKDTVTNKINSFVATLIVADDAEYIALWQNLPPLAFSNTIALIRPLLVNLQTKGAKQSADITGYAQQLKTLRTSFEIHLHLLARATYQCLSATGDLEDAQRANLTPSKLHSARGTTLAGLGETVLELAEPLLTAPPPPPPTTSPKPNSTPSTIFGSNSVPPSAPRPAPAPSAKA